MRRDDRVRNNHPIKLCSKLTPLVDTPMSPPPEERGPASNLPSSQSVGSSPQQTLDTITNHFQGMELSGFGPLANYSDCVVYSGGDDPSSRGAKKGLYRRDASRHFFTPSRGSVAGGRLRWQPLYD